MTDTVKVLIADKMDPKAAAIFRDRGIDVEEKPGFMPEELAAIIGDYDGLAVRSSTKVTASIMDAALPRLKVIVTLGDVSRRNVLRALGLKASAGIAGHGTEFPAGPYTVLNSYHCSRLNTNTGRLTGEMFEAVFQRARAIIDGA